MTERSQNKEYLGDGVYVEYVAERDMIRLTTENGVTVLEEIWLELGVYHALLRWFHNKGQHFFR